MPKSTTPKMPPRETAPAAVLGGTYVGTRQGTKSEKDKDAPPPSPKRVRSTGDAIRCPTHGAILQYANDGKGPLCCPQIDLDTDAVCGWTPPTS